MSDFVRSVVGKAALPIALTLCAALAVLLTVNYVANHKFGTDFGVYWRAANQPVEQVYFWRRQFPFPYAPTMLLWIQPLAFIPKWVAYFLFIAASLIAFVLAVRPYLPRSAIILCLISPPFVRTIFTGQVCALLAALLLWACATERRVAAGIAFGVIASIKPQLVLMAPLMLALNRDWRAFVAASATFLSALLLSLAFGIDRWPEWLASMDHFHNAVTGSNIIKVGMSPAVIAERFGFSPLPFMLAGGVAGAALVYICRHAEPLAKTAAIALGSILAAPYALDYDLLAVVPFLALAVVQGRIWAGLAITAAFPPLPLVISGYQLIRERFNGRPMSWWRKQVPVVELPAGVVVALILAGIAIQLFVPFDYG
jgi:hypothetical protein